MFNLNLSVRPVIVLPEPVAYKGNLYQMAVAMSVNLSEKDEPLITCILNPLESNQSKTISEYFKAIQDLPQAEQDGVFMNIGGLAYATDHYLLDNPSNERSLPYSDAMRPFRIPAEVLGETGDALYPDVVIFADTCVFADEGMVQSYYSMDCGYIKVYETKNDDRLSYKLQPRGPSISEELGANPTYYISPSKTVQRELAGLKAGDTASAAISGNLAAYVGQDGTAKLRFSVSRMFMGRVFDKNNVVQRETMQAAAPVRTENSAVTALRSRLATVKPEAVADDF